MIWVSLYIAVLLAGGFAAAELLADRRSPRRAVELAGMNAALGCVIVPLALLMLSMLGVRPTRAVVLGIGTAAVAVILILRFTHRLPRLARPVVPSMSRGDIAALLLGTALIAVQLFAVFLAAADVPVIEVDAWNIWGLKAKVLYSEPLSPRPEYFTDLTLSYTHLDYPLLVPMLWAGAYAAMGQMDDAAGKTWLILPLLGIVLLLYSALREVIDRAPAMLLTALAVGSPAVSRWGGQGLADTTLAVFMLGAAVCLVRWIRDRRFTDAIATGLLTAAAIWTKLEGSILLISMLAVVLTMTVTDRQRTRSAAALIATALLLALPWWLWSRGLPHTHEDYLSRLTLSQIQNGLTCLPELISLVAIQLRGWHWTIPLGVLILAAAMNYRGWNRADVRAVWCVLIVQVLAYFVAYLITPWNLSELVPITATRLAMQVAPLAMLLAGLHWREARRDTGFTQARNHPVVGGIPHPRLRHPR